MSEATATNEISAPPFKKRLDWIDAVKGTTIILVVLHHVISGLNGRPDFPVWIDHYHDYLTPVRMPLFFLVAGFFAAKALHAPLSTFLRGKVYYFMYFYFLWTAVNFVFRYSLNGITNNRTELSDLAVILWEPMPTIWFLYALMIAFVLTRLLRWMPLPYLIALAALIQSATMSQEIFVNIDILDKLGKLYVYFVLGIAASEWIRGNVEKLTWPAIAAAAVVFIDIGTIGVPRGWTDVPLPYFAMSALSAIAIMGAVYRGVAAGRLDWLVFVGRHSLFIYLTHFLPAAGTRIVLDKAFGITNVYLVIPLAVVLSVIFGILAYRLLKDTWLSWLFVLPDRLPVPTGTPARGT